MITSFTILISMLIILYIYLDGSKKVIQWLYMNKYKNYLDLFDHFLERSYNVIYKDQIQTFSINGVSLDGETLETIQRNFIKLSFELMGEALVDRFSNFFGSRKAFIVNMNVYLQERLDNDELSKMIQKTQSEEQ